MDVNISEDGTAQSPEPLQKKQPRKKSWLFRQVRFFFILVLLAILFRWLLLEAYTIPSVSMAGTLQPGDFILVSKLHYGPRTPSTLLHLPLTHRKIWATDYNSYFDVPAIRLPTWRLATWKVKHNDVVVFNYPYEDYPTELKTPYVKRCVGLPGETLAIRQSKVYANEKLLPVDYLQQFRYFLQTTKGINPDFFQKHDILEYTKHTSKNKKGYIYVIQATPKQVQMLQPLQEVGLVTGAVRQETKANQYDPSLFPTYESLPWNQDHYGSLLIPKKGLSLPMSPQNVALYGKIIQKFEANKDKKITLEDGQLRINGKIQENYTFQKNYYFMLGDNFHVSLDSRYWGLVPEDHIIGKAVFVWFSMGKEKKWWGRTVNWHRIGRID